MARTVEEIRVAEADVLRAGGDLLPDVVEHPVNGDCMKTSVVDRDDRAVPTQVLAAARGLRIAHYVLLPAR